MVLESPKILEGSSTTHEAATNSESRVIGMNKTNVLHQKLFCLRGKLVAIGTDEHRTCRSHCVSIDNTRAEHARDQRARDHLIFFRRAHGVADEMACGSFEKLSPEDVVSYLTEEVPDIDKTVLESFLKHKISGDVFLELTEEYLRELVPLLGERLRVKRAVVKAQTTTPSVVSLCDSLCGVNFICSTSSTLTTHVRGLAALTPFIVQIPAYGRFTSPGFIPCDRERLSRPFVFSVQGWCCQSFGYH